MSAHDSRVTVALSAEAERRQEEEEEEEDERRKEMGKGGRARVQKSSGQQSKENEGVKGDASPEIVIDFKVTVFLGLRNSQSNLSLWLCVKGLICLIVPVGQMWTT